MALVVPLVRYLSTRIAVMEHRKLVETGQAEEICAHPREAATPELPAGAA
jgi:ABC-type oligopeptide transport system ATPase subunit